MAKRKTQLERAIESLEGERAVLDAAITKLRQQQTQAPTKKPRQSRSAPTLLKEAASE